MKKKATTRSVAELPETPYLAARREWNERYGDYIKAANNWRLAALGSIGVAACAVIGLVAVSLQSKVVPYAVELNGHQEVVRVQRADLLAAPNANQLRASLRNWIIGARTVYGDRLAMKNQLDQTYAMTLPDSRAFVELAAYHRDNNPYQRATQLTVGVDVKVVVPVSDTSWQIEWTETTRNASGKVIKAEDWQGTFTVSISPPTDATQIMMNPLGVYVRQFSWTQRL